MARILWEVYTKLVKIMAKQPNVNCSPSYEVVTLDGVSVKSPILVCYIKRVSKDLKMFKTPHISFHAKNCVKEGKTRLDGHKCT